MDTDRRVRLSPEARRAQLVALGVAALVDRPLESVTIEYLSEQAGVSGFDPREGLSIETRLAGRRAGHGVFRSGDL